MSVVFGNETKYPDLEVFALASFAIAPLSLSNLAVIVKPTNKGHAYSGTAYKSVPRNSPIRVERPDVKNLVYVRIGPKRAYPCSSGRSVTRWKIALDTRSYDAYAQLRDEYSGNVQCTTYHLRDGTYRYVVKVPTSTTYEGYGGKKSPIISLQNWREGVVALAAHEAFHIMQFRNGWPAREWECERFALDRLETFRDQGGEPHIYV